jgi:polar amino acid transport system permease protein
MSVTAGSSASDALRAVRRSPITDMAGFVVVVAGLVWLTARGTEASGYNWQWYRIPHYFWTYEEGRIVWGPLVRGLLVTFQITIISLFLSFIIGLITALFRQSQSFTAQFAARVYLEIIRNTPLLIQIFFIYFVLGPVLDISRFASAVLALSLFEGAYASEIFRAGIISIHSGQWEAAYSLGLGTYHTYRHIILPQAVRRVLPPLTGQAISLIKDSALVSTIAIYDLTMRGQEIVSETFLTFEVWFTVAAVYLGITLTLSIIVHYLEHRMRIT